VAISDSTDWDGTILQYGQMHDAIGRQQHDGRVQLKVLAERPHFFGVAALERLAGEATIYDGTVTVTMVDAKGRLKPSDDSATDRQATLLVGAYVPSWTEHKVLENVGPDEFDRYISDVASRSGIDTSTPFVFTVAGEFSDVRLHVINGACPLHARMKKIEIPKENRPFEAEFETIRATMVGVFAKDAVGDITHPATSTHTHLLFQDTDSGKMVTGHVERAGLCKGTVLRLPK
jgi:alpha-acetolactate decarboxylase